MNYDIEIEKDETSDGSIITFDFEEDSDKDGIAFLLRLLSVINDDKISEIRLRFWSPDWTNDDLESLASLSIAQRITELNLTENTDLTDEGMVNIARLVGLRRFHDFSNRGESQITGAGFAPLEWLPHLKEIGLDIEALDAGKVAAISRMKHLETLLLLGNPDDGNLDVLSRLRPQQPITIDINDPDYEAEYSVESLLKLADVPNLRHLFIRRIPKGMSSSVGRELVTKSHDLTFVQLGSEEFTGIVTVPEIQPSNELKGYDVWYGC